MDDGLWVIEVVVREAPSVMDRLMRGQPHVGPFRGSLTRRERETESVVLAAPSRDAAIGAFRRLTGYGGAIERVAGAREADVLRSLEAGVGERLRLPGAELDRVREAASRIFGRRF